MNTRWLLHWMLVTSDNGKWFKFVIVSNSFCLFCNAITFSSGSGSVGNWSTQSASDGCRHVPDRNCHREIVMLIQVMVVCRCSLEEVRKALQERVQRWQMIEHICGFDIISNPGLAALECQLKITPRKGLICMCVLLYKCTFLWPASEWRRHCLCSSYRRSWLMSTSWPWPSTFLLQKASSWLNLLLS